MGFWPSRNVKKYTNQCRLTTPNFFCIEYNSLIAFRCRQRTAKTWRSSWRPRSSSALPRTGWTWTKRSTNLFASSVASRLKLVSSPALVTPWKTLEKACNYYQYHQHSIICRLLSGLWLRAKGRRLQGRKANVLFSSPHLHALVSDFNLWWTSPTESRQSLDLDKSWTWHEVSSPLLL